MTLHGNQHRCATHQNGTPFRYPRSNGGPIGKSTPPIMRTPKIKKRRWNPEKAFRLSIIHGRIRSSEAANGIILSGFGSELMVMRVSEISPDRGQSEKKKGAIGLTNPSRKKSQARFFNDSLG